MSTRGPLVFALVIACSLALALIASGDRGIRIGINSQQYGPGVAAATASISSSRTRPGHAGGPTSERHRGSSEPQRGATSLVIGGAITPAPPVRYSSIPAASPLLAKQQPRGPKTFWYSDGSGHACIYVPIGSSLCYIVTGPSGAGVPAVNPGVIAASASDRLSLGAGRIEASPARAGFTGAESWFWLDPAPQSQRLSISLGGETVSVNATPKVEWRFGDGVVLMGGGGIPYEASAAPTVAIRHVYETRCLPGDQGHDTNVLPSCGSDGYMVEAVVSWRIDYDGSGPVAASGTLPTRTTTSTTDYPVSEARAFLLSVRTG
jgi:hypothetical protein